MTAHVPDAEKLPKKLTPFIVTALIGKILAARFAPEYYFGMAKPGRASAVAQLAEEFGGKRALDRACCVQLTHEATVADHLEVKVWMESTRRLLGKVDQSALKDADDALVDNTVHEILQSLIPSLQGKTIPKAEIKLRKICTLTFELFGMLHRSKAVFYLQFAGVASKTRVAPFQQKFMEVVGDGEAGSLEGRILQIAVFPAVLKYGDEMGNNVSSVVSGA